jgi:hypothetical protein
VRDPSAAPEENPINMKEALRESIGKAEAGIDKSICGRGCDKSRGPGGDPCQFARSAARRSAEPYSVRRVAARGRIGAVIEHIIDQLVGGAGAITSAIDRPDRTVPGSVSKFQLWHESPG